MSHPETTDESDTRSALIRAAIDEFAERGYEAASLNAICARAQFSRGAFYFHFASKEDLLLASLKWVLEDFYSKVTAPSGIKEYLERLGRLVAKRMEVGAVDHPPADSRTFTHMPFHRLIAASDELASVRRLMAKLEGDAAKDLGRSVLREQNRGTIRRDESHENLGELLTVLGIGIGAASELGYEFEPSRLNATMLRLLAPQQDV